MNAYYFFFEAQGLQPFFAAQGLQPFFAAQGLQLFLALQGLHPANWTGVTRLAAAAGSATLEAAKAATLRATAVFFSIAFSCLRFVAARLSGPHLIVPHY
tara:strand:- start:255 stop:554 length:300 start_codon:yes stop_codon:yes gene_type:complete